MLAGSGAENARGRALFLDVDGTLLEIAETPEGVRVPAHLKELLARLASKEAGALALVSGRRLAEIDRLFAPYFFAAAGLHGLERRDSSNRYVSVCPDSLTALPAFAIARNELATFAVRYPKLLFEDKGVTLALHFRRAPEMAYQVAAIMESLLDTLGPQFHLQPGKCVLELKPAAGTKRKAIEMFMDEEPFRTRRPVFIGDDETDEGGFAAVNARGGDSIRVGPATATVARFRLGNVQDVIDWLIRLLNGESAT